MNLSRAGRPAIFLLLLAAYFLADGLWIYAKALLAQELIASAWHQTLETSDQVKPWPWADTWPVGRLQSQRHDIDLYILDGVHGHALAFGPGQMSTVAGWRGTGPIVVAGHRDTHFRFLEYLRPDEILVFTNHKGELEEFLVSTVEIVDSEQQVLTVDRDLRELVLVTCYPFNSVIVGGPLRYLVRALPRIIPAQDVETEELSIYKPLSLAKVTIQ